MACKCNYNYLCIVSVQSTDKILWETKENKRNNFRYQKENVMGEIKSVPFFLLCYELASISWDYHTKGISNGTQCAIFN